MMCGRAIRWPAGSQPLAPPSRRSQRHCGLHLLAVTLAPLPIRSRRASELWAGTAAARDRYRTRLSGKGLTVSGGSAKPRAGVAGSPGGGRDPVVVELQEVVGGCDQAPLRPRGGPASSSEPGHPAVVFDLPEHRLDAVSSFDVQLAAEIGARARGA